MITWSGFCLRRLKTVLISPFCASWWNFSFCASLHDCWNPSSNSFALSYPAESLNQIPGAEIPRCRQKSQNNQCHFRWVTLVLHLLHHQVRFSAKIAILPCLIPVQDVYPIVSHKHILQYLPCDWIRRARLDFYTYLSLRGASPKRFDGAYEKYFWHLDVVADQATSLWPCSHSSGDVKAIQVHHLIPGRHEVID